MRIDRDKLRAQLPPPREAFLRQMDDMLRALPVRKEEKRMKKKVSVGLAMVLALALLATGIAVATQWDVLTFLFGGEEKDAAQLVQPVSAVAEAGNVTLRVTSALTDGEYLAMDWQIANQTPDQPAYVQVEAFTANGVPLALDGTDDFDAQWLPGWCNDGSMQDGELTELPEGVDGDVLEVCMTVGIYRPKKPVWLMDAFDAAEAQAKQAEGYYVLAEGDGFVEEEPGEGLVQTFGYIRPEDDRYDRAELTLRFTLDMEAGRASTREIAPPDAAAFRQYEVRWEKLTVSPLAVRASVVLMPEDGWKETADRLILDGRFQLTDGDGKVLDGEPMGETFSEPDREGRPCVRVELAYIGCDTAALPEVLTLSWLADDGTPTAVQQVSMP